MKTPLISFKSLSTFGFAALLLAGAAVFSNNVFSEENSYCEVAAVTGEVKVSRFGQAVNDLKQGDTLSKGDIVTLGPGASADLAFDEEWNNVSRLSENSRVIIRSVNPVRMDLMAGDIYSKLDKLPQGSSFEIKTPEAIAAVRGTKFRVTHENGFTTVTNDSETSLVYVYHLDENGNRAGKALVVEPGASVTVVGEAEVFDSLQEELEESRDREDQDQLNDDLNRLRSSQSSGETPGQNDNFGINR